MCDMYSPFLSPKGGQGAGGHGITTSLDLPWKTGRSRPTPFRAKQSLAYLAE